MKKTYARISITLFIILSTATAFLAVIFCTRTYPVASAGSNGAPLSAAHLTADGDVVEYLKFAPANPVAGGTAGVTNVPVRDMYSGQIEFYVPETYYVKTEEYNPDTDYYPVDFANISAINKRTYYIKLSDLNGIKPQPVEFGITDNPYPTTILQLNEGASFKLGGKQITSADGYTLRYVGGFRDANGNVSNDEIYITAIKGDSSFAGRVPKSNFAAFSVPYHPITEAELSPDPDNPSGGDNTVAPSKALRIILIIGIIVPAVIIIILLFKPSKDGNNYDKRAMRKSSRKAPGTDYDRERSYDGRKRAYDRDYDRRDYERDYEYRDYERGARRDYDDRLGYDERRPHERKSYDDRDGRYDR